MKASVLLICLLNAHSYIALESLTNLVGLDIAAHDSNFEVAIKMISCFTNLEVLVLHCFLNPAQFHYLSGLTKVIFCGFSI